MGKGKILKTIFSASGVIVIAKLLGFAKQMITASYFGATTQTDIISLSQGFVGNLEYLLFQTLVTSFLPIYMSTREYGGKKEQRFVSDVIKLFLGISVSLVVILLLASPLFAKVIAPTYSEQMLKGLSKYIAFFSPLLALFTLIALFRALLNANEKFIPGELVAANQSIIVIVMVFLLASSLGVNVLVISSYIYSIWNVFFLGILSRKYWCISKGNPLKNADIHRLLRMIPPLLLGYAMVYVNQIADKMLISGLEAGAVTAMSYASTLSSLVATFISAFCSVLFTYVTQNIVKHNQKGAANLVNRFSVILITLLLPISILTVICSHDIVTIVFARGAFEQEAVKNASKALAGYGVMFVPYVFRELFGQFQYGYQDSKRPMVNSTIGILVNVCLSVLSCPILGIFGVTLSTSVSVMVCGLLNAFAAKKHNEYLKFKTIYHKIPFWVCGGGACIIVADWGMNRWRECHTLIRFLLVITFAFIAYLLVVSPILWSEIRLKVKNKTNISEEKDEE